MKTSSPSTVKEHFNLAFTLLLGAFVALGLSACAESQNDAADTADMSQDTAMTEEGQAQRDGMGAQDGSMGGESVSLQNTNRLLQQGVTSIGAQQAVQNIQGWEDRLGNLNASGEVQQVVSDMTNTLGNLRSALEGGQPEMQQVNQAFSQLSQQMDTLMQNASSLNLQGQQQQRLQQLQQVIQQTSQQLGSM